MPRRHPVDVAWRDQLHAADAVAVQKVAFQQVAHSGQADVRVTADIAVRFGAQSDGAHVVKKHKGADRPLERSRQHTAHLQALRQLAHAALKFQQFRHPRLLAFMAVRLNTQADSPRRPSRKSLRAW